MGTEHEEAVRAFFQESEGPKLDAAQVERLVARMAPDARYHVFAWEDPIVGRDAIYDEFLRQASSTSNGRVELLAMASVGGTVFVERRDFVTIEDKDVAVHVTGVFEVDDDGKIASWRDYFDSREVATKVGRPPSRR